MDVQKLLHLAADRSPTARSDLIHVITDLFIPDMLRLTEHERALMQDILGKLISAIETDVRANLAEALARAEIGMPDLERMLADDEIEVARPILEKSRLLHDEDLIAIIKRRTDEHRMIIAMREAVSEPVSDALVSRSGPDVLETLLRNPNANISRRAMEYLVAESKRQDRFQEPLVLRSDLPADLALRMYWWVTAALRRKIMKHFPVDEKLLDDVLQEAAQRALVEQTDDQSAQARGMRLAYQLKESGELDEHFTVRLLKQHRLTLFIACLAVMARISYLTAWKIVTDPGIESPVVLARAIGMSRQGMTEMMLLLIDARSGGGPRKTGILTTLSTLYDEIDPVQARRVLSIWQRDIQYQAAIDALAEHKHG